MVHTKNTVDIEKTRCLVILERSLKRAVLQQSKKIGCKSRPEQGSISEFLRTAAIEKLEKLGVNVSNLIANG